jgi:hypothetical protein
VDSFLSKRDAIILALSVLFTLLPMAVGKEGIFISSGMAPVALAAILIFSKNKVRVLLLYLLSLPAIAFFTLIL